MKKTITLFLLTLSVSLTAQIQSNMPWAEKSTKDNLSKKNNTTLEDYTENAEQYFKTIDRDAKGSGLKPFKRWEHHWSYYVNSNNVIASKEQLWEAWEQKRQLAAKDEDNNGDWKPLGPYVNSNTHSSNNFKQTGKCIFILNNVRNCITYPLRSPFYILAGLWIIQNFLC